MTLTGQISLTDHVYFIAVVQVSLLLTWNRFHSLFFDVSIADFGQMAGY